MSGEQPEVVEYERADEAVRDGVGEEDNPIPLWFNVGFYGLMVFGVLYILFYLLTDWSSLGEYEVQVAAAEAQSRAVRAALPTSNPYTGNAAAIEEGREVFATICMACHKADGSGMVGPSLVDPYWKYGGSDAERFQSVAEGRPGGMPPWLAQLGTEKIWKALAYASTLQRSAEPGVGSPEYVAPTAGAAPTP